ncbi:hypothetical protein [Hoeflea ulvae]|uniref:Uncharacterized protein n=1 Tax=Hoeflea ulvae TaxID=2983764 RepID=A0ABT3YG65_9HYPH|nr:hypothetical protein [Hoeflea ulvae]MCY0094894.1 hypothetical protein [Hoeflea ulvae]
MRLMSEEEASCTPSLDFARAFELNPVIMPTANSSKPHATMDSAGPGQVARMKLRGHAEKNAPCLTRLLKFSPAIDDMRQIEPFPAGLE